MTTWSKNQITLKLDQFRNWLSANGAELLQPTNEYELVRFRAGDKTGIIYWNTKGGSSFVQPALEAWEAFKGAHSWRAAPATTRRKKSSVTLQAVRARDGSHCFYCLSPVLVEDESEEHLVSITHGGPNHISNIFLAHKLCNARAGNLSAPEKIALHVAQYMNVKS
ncbi:HNH endonuclease [Solimicrobium silvestre]|uniref:HNH endonuclease n=1 Tax=Solimicrobium silvestre TaxID=2099400 RepID=A0A2S9GY22_9BURK|nr:HNH endonuclease [Solimicrobium silvestre]PRC92624.1 HNH endonuclease [Solimicrobium silvestre]